MDVIGISTNSYPILTEIDEDMKIYIQKVLCLKPEIEEFLKSKLSQLPETYHLFHYRLGDSYLLNNDSQDNIVYLEHFSHYKKENSVVISDSLSFKKELSHLYQNKEVFVFLNKPYHTVTNEADIETLIDFFFILHAKTVNCYSNYRWISNFVFWSSIVYNVPLFNMRPLNLS
jgi:hypothetical protein